MAADDPDSARANERRRRGRSEQRGADAAVVELESREAEPFDRLAQREAVERIAQAIESLAKPYREVLALRHVHGLSAVEIARALDRPLGTVHAQLQRGVERLRGVLPAGFAAAFCALVDSRPSLRAAPRSSRLPLRNERRRSARWYLEDSP